MQFGLQINPYLDGPTGNPWDSVARVARATDASAFDSLWVYDHFLYEGGYSGHPYSEPVMECFTTLGAIAAVTERIRLGQLVLGVPYRNPAAMAKMATTLDLISHGRSILGLGAGWHKREYEAYGWGEFEPAPVRMKRLEEALRVVLAIWTERPAHFEGDILSPRSGAGESAADPAAPPADHGRRQRREGDAAARRPVRPVLQCLGRPRDRRTPLRQPARPLRAARSALRGDYPLDLYHRARRRDEADVAAKRERLAPFLPDGALIGTPDQLIETFQEYARAGCQYVVFRTPDWVDVEPVQLFAERVIPALAGQ